MKGCGADTVRRGGRCIAIAHPIRSLLASRGEGRDAQPKGSGVSLVRRVPVSRGRAPSCPPVLPWRGRKPHKQRAKGVKEVDRNGGGV